MKDRPKIDLQQHVSKRISRKFILRIIFYIALLTTVGIIIYKKKQASSAQNVEEVKEIRNIKVQE
jgi:hypothetical protein